MDIVTYALLKKKITSALTGVSNIELDPEHSQTIVFTTNDGTEFKIKIPTPDLVWVGEEAPPADSEYELWVDTSDSGIHSSGNAILAEDLVATTIIGQVTKGKTYPAGTQLEDIIRDILTSYTKPTVAITINPTTELYNKVTDKIEKITVKAAATKGTEDIQSITFYVNGSPHYEITSDDIKDGGTFTDTISFNPETNETFILKVTVNDGKENTTVTKTIKFIGKSYWGTVEGEEFEVTEDLIKALPFNTLKDSRTLIYQDIKVDYGKILYAYPKELGKIVKVVDDNGFDTTTSYTIGEISVDELDYYYVLLTDAMGTDGAYQKFT